MILKRIRIILAVITFALISFFFVDFAGLLPTEHFPLAKIQFLPALLGFSFGIVAVLLLLTLLFGRIYCSVICPFGIFQDLASRLAKRFVKHRKYTFSTEKKWIRYGSFAVVAISFFSGFSILLSLLEPYSAYGRIATHLLRPVYMTANNGLAAIFNHFGNYTFYHTEVFLLSFSSLLIAIATLLSVGYLAWKYGRTYCNTLCPVGTILGLVSRFSMFRIQMKESDCTHCGLCIRNCKASCIDHKNNYVDASRCVSCFNCTTVCKTKAINYTFAWKKREKTVCESTETIKNKPKECVETANLATETIQQSRRRFLTILGVSTLTAGTHLFAESMHLKTNKPWNRKSPLSPPGSLSAEHLLNHCTACHLCVSKCPSHILKPALLEYGLGGMMQPVMDFSHGFCNYDCTVCTDVCPNGALHPLTKEEKHLTQMGRVIFIQHNCVVYTDGTLCGACSEHCPTQAVTMVPYKDDLTIPSINPDICVGCGGCEYVCPAKPSKAIYVEGNPVHLQAKPFEEKKEENVSVDSFGF
jgi:ferredoxin